MLYIFLKLIFLLFIFKNPVKCLGFTFFVPGLKSFEVAEEF